MKALALKTAGVLASLLFTVGTTVTYGVETIAAAEYFFDVDPGEGSGTVLLAVDGSFDSDEEAVSATAISTTGLSIGLHRLFVRMQSASGVWGLAREQLIAVTGTKKIMAAEYFIDTDPGEGSGTAIPATDGMLDSAEEAVVATAIDTTNLSEGLHTAFVRMKNADGQWGPARQYTFDVSAPTTLVSAEYFVDSDPGVGAASPLVAIDGTFDEETENVSVTTMALDQARGMHTVFVRAQDSYGRWTLDPLSFEFEISAPTFAEWIVRFDLAGQVGEGDDPDGDGLTNLEEHGLDTLPGDFDSEDDGLPDGFESANGLNPLLFDRDDDLDGDNFSNYVEFLLGTDPGDPDLIPNVVASLSIRTAAELVFPTESGVQYQLQDSANLDFWQDFGSPIEGNGDIQFVPVSTFQIEQMFYRLTVPSQ